MLVEVTYEDEIPQKADCVPPVTPHLDDSHRSDPASFAEPRYITEGAGEKTGNGTHATKKRTAMV
ncbi:hypothetical protein PT7_P064 (plasmid) [Pusillimonas sp. T7-7]|nr:hypothetical protein PT7_P064 [Pusillimonas sp. T7-7]